MYDHLRRVARRIARQLFPISAGRRQQPLMNDPLSTAPSQSAVTALRPRRDPAPPFTWVDDLPLVRPYGLAARYHVSTPTLRDALELLRAEGLIEKFQGRGNFVRRPPQRLTYPGLGGADGLHTIVSFADITATGDLAARLRTEPDAAVTEYVCLSHRDDSPQSLAHLYVPQAGSHAASPVGTSQISTSPWADDIVAALATTAGVPVATSTDLVTARFPTSAEAQSLRIATRTPVLAIERTITADDGQVVAYALLVLPGDRAEIALVTRITKKEVVG